VIIHVLFRYLALPVCATLIACRPLVHTSRLMHLGSVPSLLS
jgi:hypothetical protein